MAVVDSRARVFGVDGLRVVDVSAFPLLVPGHPQSSVCKCSSGMIELMLTFVDMLAEKIADDIIHS